MEQSFLSPLVDLLIAVIRTGERRYREVYLDERLRYAPHQAEPAVIAKFFSELLPGDEAALVDSLDDQGAARALGSLLADLHAPLRGPREGTGFASSRSETACSMSCGCFFPRARARWASGSTCAASTSARSWAGRSPPTRSRGSSTRPPPSSSRSAS